MQPSQKALWMDEHLSHPAAPEGTELWPMVAEALEAELSANAFESWIAPLKAVDYSAGRIRLSAPTRFIRDFVQNQYVDRIRTACRRFDPQIFYIELVVAVAEPQKAQNLSLIPQEQHPDVSSTIDYSTPLDPRYTFANFVVGEPNQFAFAAAKRVAESPEILFNPLFLYGGVGLGKTHLMHAIAAHIKEHTPERKVVYLSAEKFMYQFVQALKNKDIATFKDYFRTTDVLMIDDIQFIVGKDATIEEFFHTFNNLFDNKKQLIFAANKSPQDLDGLGESLKSRLVSGLVADLHATTYELRLDILSKKKDLLGANVGADVLNLLATNISSSVRELEGALNRVCAHTSLLGLDVTVDSTTSLLHDTFRAAQKKQTVDVNSIQKIVAEHFSVSLADLLSARRLKTITKPRQIAIYLTKQLTTLTFSEIGHYFGKRDRTTILYTLKKLDQMLKKDASLSQEIQMLKHKLA